VVLIAALWAGARIVGMEISAVNLAAAGVSAVTLAMGFGTIALAVGSATGRRGTALGVAAAPAVAGYLVNSLAALVPWLGGARLATPLHHYAAANALGDGFSLGHLAALLLVVAVATAAALVAVDRRDLRG
jgi:ABC-2 type transport system permease protein